MQAGGADQIDNRTPRLWSPRASRDIAGGRAIEWVFGEKLFGLRCGDKGGIACNTGESELVVSEEAVGAQGHRQLDSIIGLEGMLLGQMRRCGKVIRAQRHNRKTMGELTHEATIGTIPLCPPDPTDARDDGQPGSDLSTCDLSDKDDDDAHGRSRGLAHRSPGGLRYFRVR